MSVLARWKKWLLKLRSNPAAEPDSESTSEAEAPPPVETVARLDDRIRIALVLADDWLDSTERLRREEGPDAPLTFIQEDGASPQFSGVSHLLAEEPGGNTPPLLLEMLETFVSDTFGETPQELC